MLLENPAANFAWYCRSLMLAEKQGIPLSDITVRGAPERVQRILKNVPGGTTVSGNWGNELVSNDFATMIGAFTDSLRNRSVFYRLLDGGFTRVPLRTRAAVVTTGATGSTGEGRAIPVRQLTLSAPTLQITRAAAMFVCSDELLRNVSSAGQSLFSRELRGAISDSVDAEFLNQVIDTGTLSLSSTGSDVEAVLADLRALLNAVDTTGNAALFWVVSSDVAKFASVLYGSGGFVFPAMSPLGGEMLNLPALVCSSLAPGTLFLVNAAGIAADSDTIEVRTSTSADIEMLADPTGNSATPVGVNTVSMFETNSAASRITVYFAAEKMRSDLRGDVERHRVGNGMMAPEKTSAASLSIADLAEHFDKVYQRIEPLERELVELRARSAFQYRGVWKADNMYAAGDFVTCQGGIWHCGADGTKAKPGGGRPWTLAVKSGRDAR
jgi:hypothetical protein